MRTIFATPFVMATLAFSTSPLFATVLNVPLDYPSIASALIVAVPGDEVLIAAGTYQEHDLVIPSGVVIRGASGTAADVIIDGKGAGRCFYGTNLSAATRLEALTLTNGVSRSGQPFVSWGAGLMVDGGSLTVSNCVFTGNVTGIGGGAFIKGTGSPVFSDCIFDGNRAAESAGLALSVSGDPVVQNCVFRNGEASFGGGLTWDGLGHLLMEDCTVEDNAVFDGGGGVEVFGFGVTATLRNCLIRRNSSGRGAGGLSVFGFGQVVLEQCEIIENSADDFSGGISLGDGTVLEAFDSTILNNTAPIGADCLVGTTATATLTCSNIDLAAWDIRGSFSHNMDGCGVPIESTTWGGVKAMYR